MKRQKHVFTLKKMSLPDEKASVFSGKKIKKNRRVDSETYEVSINDQPRVPSQFRVTTKLE